MRAEKFKVTNERAIYNGKHVYCSFKCHKKAPASSAAQGWSVLNYRNQGDVDNNKARNDPKMPAKSSSSLVEMTLMDFSKGQELNSNPLLCKLKKI